MKFGILISILRLRWRVMLNYFKFNKQSRTSSINSPITMILFSMITLLILGTLFSIAFSKINDPVKLHLAATIALLFISLILIMYRIISGQFAHSFVCNAGDIEFLKCQPLNVKELVAAKLIEYAGSDFVSFLTMLSFFWAIALKTTGIISGFILILLATLLAVLYINTTLLIVDQILRRIFNPEKLRNILTVIMFVAGIIVIILMGNMNALIMGINSIIVHPGEFVILFAFSPVGWLINTFISLGNNEYDLLFYNLFGVIYGFGFCLYLAFYLIGWLGKTGWTMVENPYAISNRHAASNRIYKKGLLKGFLKKDFLMYRRDPKILFKAIGIPFLFIVLNLVPHMELPEKVIKGPANMAMFIFGNLAFVSAFCCVRTLDAERKSIWIFYTLPQTVESILWSKVKMWFIILVGIGISSFVTAAVWYKWPFLSSTGNGILLAVGLFMVAIMGIGISASSSDLKSNKFTTVNPSAAFVFLFFAYSFLLVFFTKELWPKVICLSLFSGLTLACWQAGVWRIRYILDAEHRGPKQISVGDGLATIAIYFFLQSILGITIGYFYSQISVKLAASYTLSGIITSIIAIYYARQIVENKIEILGVIEKSTFFNCFKGITLGFVSGLIAIIYLITLKQFGFYDVILEKSLFQSTLENGLLQWTFVVTLVLIAPIAEEIIFRGVLFQSLNNVWPGKFFAVLVGALLFAIVHPLASVIPVFILGVITCELYKNKKCLAPSIIAHSIHNAIVIFAQWYLG